MPLDVAQLVVDAGSRVSFAPATAHCCYVGFGCEFALSALDPSVKDLAVAVYKLDKFDV
jgi:hypothetical protein